LLDLVFVSLRNCKKENIKCMTLIGETTPYYVKGETGAPVG
jgi:hypothetical protein